MTKARICTIPDCGKPHASKGYYSNHYYRFRAHGDPFAGRVFDGQPLVFLEASIVAETDDCILWPYGKMASGYGKIKIDGKDKSAHREVCRRVHGEPPTPKHQAAHAPIICHNRLCVNPRHLRWATRKENNADKLMGIIYETRQSGRP